MRLFFKPSVLIRGLVMIATLLAVGFLLEGLGLKAMLETGWVDSEVRGQGINGELLYIGVAMAFTALGLPRQVVCFLGGYAFGFWLGAALALLSTVLSCIGTFFYARLMGRNVLAKRFPGRLKKIDDFLSGNPMMMALVLRLSPFSSNLVANLAAGVSGVKPLPFFAGSAIGYLPQTIVFALLGAGLELDPVLNTTLSVSLFIISTLLGLVLWRRFRKLKGLSPEDGED